MTNPYHVPSSFAMRETHRASLRKRQAPERYLRAGYHEPENRYRARRQERGSTPQRYRCPAADRPRCRSGSIVYTNTYLGLESRGDADVRTLLSTTMLFVLTACAEILGCYTVYLWLKAARSRWWLVPGAVSLGLFAWLLTLHPSSSAGRIYAAYGGVYIATAMLWQWVVEHQRPDRWDVLGAGVCLTGMVIIMLGPRTP